VINLRLQRELMQAVVMADRERKVRWLLSRWVSGLTPAVAYGPSGEILGLCDADAPIGSKPVIFRG
jgi:hypothetical protein